MSTPKKPQIADSHTQQRSKLSSTKSFTKAPSKPPYRPLNLQAHEVTALEIVLEGYLGDRQSTLLSKVGDIHISKILDKVRRLK